MCVGHRLMMDASLGRRACALCLSCHVLLLKSGPCVISVRTKRPRTSQSTCSSYFCPWRSHWNRSAASTARAWLSAASPPPSHLWCQRRTLFPPSARKHWLRSPPSAHDPEHTFHWSVGSLARPRQDLCLPNGRQALAKVSQLKRTCVKPPQEGRRI